MRSHRGHQEALRHAGAHRQGPGAHRLTPPPVLASPPRAIRHRYQDPLDLVWLETARRLGLRVARSAEVYASYDGAGTLTLGEPASLDADDSLAQLLFHELCHALTEGPGSLGLPDWGLDNATDRDLGREHACLRLQAALAGPHGLRGFLAATTDFRAYYDALPADPLAGDEEAAIVARAALAAADPRWRETIDDALVATARIVEAARPFAGEGSLYR